MFDIYDAYQAQAIVPTGNGRSDYRVGLYGRGISRFHRLRAKGLLRQAFGKLTGRSRRLLDLDDVRRAKTVEAMSEAGCQTIAVAQIKGSECRVCDYDCEFLPMRESDRQRWAGIYAAWVSGVYLPAISVVQVGDTYYIRDGHHRVSVARQLGIEYIEANVQVWQTHGETVAAPAMSMQLVTSA